MLRLFRSKSAPEEQDAVVGLLRHYVDADDEYWELLDTTLPLGDGFDFGAVAGSAAGPDAAALECFGSWGAEPERLFELIDARFEACVRRELPDFELRDLRAEFFLRSLTTTDAETFEFGLHARSADVFVELFVRGGVVTELHVDRDCCDD